MKLTKAEKDWKREKKIKLIYLFIQAIPWFFYPNKTLSLIMFKYKITKKKTIQKIK